MSGLLLIVYMISVSLSCMVLGLAITYCIFHKNNWGSWYIVFQSCLFTTIVLGCVNFISESFFSPAVANVFSYIFEIMMHATMSVVCVLIPYFLRWILNTAWTSWHKFFFFTAGIIYFAIGLLSVLIRNEIVAVIVQSAILFLICLYSIILLWSNLKNVPNEHSRGVCLAFNIVCLCMIPLAVLSFIFDDVRAFSYPSYIIVLSIVMMVYFFIRFNIDSNRDKKLELDNNSFGDYKVTDRELEIIKLVCDGLTNKEIAAELNISVNTVNNHVANIFDKVGARSRVDLLNMIKSGPWD